MESMKIYICEDNPAFAENIKKYLPKTGNFEITGHSSTAETALADDFIFKSDVLLLDLEMPGRGGIWLIEQLSGIESRPEILVLTSFNSEEKVFEAIKKGASGYLIKSAGIRRIAEALEDVRAGGVIIDPSLAGRFWSLFLASSGKEKETYDLTELEKEVLLMVAKGLSNPEVGSAMGRSRTNIKKILSKIYKKMNVSSRVEAVTKALKKGIISVK